MHGSEFKFFVSIVRKLEEIIIKSRIVATFENCEIFPAYCFSYVRGYEDALMGGKNPKNPLKQTK